MAKKLSNEEAKTQYQALKDALTPLAETAYALAQETTQAQLQARTAAAKAGDQAKGDRIMAALGRERCSAREDEIRAAIDTARAAFDYLVRIAAGDDPSAMLHESAPRHWLEAMEKRRNIENTIRDAERA